MDVNTLIIIDNIAKLGSFTAAAKVLGMPNSNLSFKVKKLEEELGQAIFSRSTRSVNITEFGEKILKLSSPLAPMVEGIKALSEEASKEVAGQIRISTSFDVGLYLIDNLIPAFKEDFPKVKIQLDLNNRFVNLIEEGFDFAIRASLKSMADSALKTVKLAQHELKLYARRDSPFGKVSSLRELKTCPLLGMEEKIKIFKGSKVKELDRHEGLIVRDMAGIKQAVISGAGIGLIPSFTCADSFSQSQLINILPEWSGASAWLQALFPDKSTQLRRNRLFLDHLKKHFQNL